MAYQTPMTHGSRGSSDGSTPAEKLSNTAGNVADVTHDILTLAELQGKLFLEELKQLWRRSATSVIIALLGAAMLLGATPVALLAIAGFLANIARWSLPASLLLTFVVCAGLAVSLLAVAWLRLRTCLQELDKSRTELARNVEWFRHVWRRKGRSASFRYRRTAGQSRADNGVTVNHP